MNLQPIKISNIKASLKTTSKPKKLRKFANILSDYTHRPLTNSFFLLKLHINNHTCVVTVYYKGHVNLTGLKSTKELQTIVNVVSNIPGIKKIHSCSIDNITGTSILEIGSLFGRSISFSHIVKEIEKEPQVKTVKYSPQKFPGAFIKLHDKGTVTLFPSGKFNILGCCTVEKVERLVELTNKLINKQVLSHGCHS